MKYSSTFSLGQKVGWGNDQSEALQRERRGKIGGKGANQVPHPDEGLQQLCWAGTAHPKFANNTPNISGIYNPDIYIFNFRLVVFNTLVNTLLMTSKRRWHRCFKDPISLRSNLSPAP